LFPICSNVVSTWRIKLSVPNLHVYTEGTSHVPQATFIPPHFRSSLLPSPLRGQWVGKHGLITLEQMPPLCSIHTPGSLGNHPNTRILVRDALTPPPSPPPPPLKQPARRLDESDSTRCKSRWFCRQAEFLLFQIKNRKFAVSSHLEVGEWLLRHDPWTWPYCTEQ